MVRLFIILLIPFLGVVLASIKRSNNYYTIPISLVSVIFFIVALIILWRLLGVIIEVKKIIDEEKKGMETKTVDALLVLQEKLAVTKEEKEEFPLFLKDVWLIIEEADIKDEEKEFEFPINVKKELKVVFYNNEELMVKNLDVGLTFSGDFMVEKSKYYSIVTESNGDQTVRYEIDKIHGKTRRRK